MVERIPRRRRYARSWLMTLVENDSDRKSVNDLVVAGWLAGWPVPEFADQRGTR